jgi:hypothetical protein
MNSNRVRFLMNIITVLTIVSMLFTQVVPGGVLPASAQDETTPTAEPTEPVATDVPPVESPTLETPVEQPTVVSTDAPTDVPTDVVPTEAPTDILPTETPVATEIPVVTAFSDDFQDGVLDGWFVTPGWQVGVEGENIFLTTSGAGEVAAVENLSLSDLALAVRARIADGGQAVVRFRVGAEDYAVTLDAAGNVVLLRAGVLVGQGVVMPSVDPASAPVWHTLNIQAVGGSLSVSVDGVTQIAFEDALPIFAGGIRFESGATSVAAVTFDQIMIA